MREMKDSGIEWIGKIPKNWSTSKLKYLFSSGKGLSITKQDLEEYGLPVVSYGQIHSKLNSGTGINADLIRFVSKRFSIHKQCKVNKFDFIFADTSEDYDGCGNCCYNRNDNIIYAGYHCIVLHSLNNEDNRYLAYLFKTDSWRKQIREIASGVKVFSITQKNIINASVMLPSKEEQQKIADFLDQKCSEIDALTADIQTQIETLEEYKKSVITEAITKGLDPNVEMKDSGVEWIGKIPKGWKVGRIKNIISILTDYTANGSFADLARNVSYIDFEGFARLVRLTDLRSDLNNSDAVYVSEYSYEYLSKSKLFGNEILIANVGAYAGLFCLMPVNKGLCTLGPNMFLLRTNSKMTFKYFYYTGHSKFVEEQLLHKSQSTAQPKLNKYDVKSIYIIIPSIEEQQVITDFLDQKCSEIAQTISEKQQQLETLSEYKKSLIYEYVTGKKEVD